MTLSNDIHPYVSNSNAKAKAVEQVRHTMIHNAINDMEEVIIALNNLILNISGESPQPLEERPPKKADPPLCEVLSVASARITDNNQMELHLIDRIRSLIL